MIHNRETLALVEELYEICSQRGYDLALMPELAEQQHAIQAALAEITARLDMNARILVCLQEHQEYLLARGHTSAQVLEEDWARFLAAMAAYTMQCHVTVERATLLHRCYRKLLRKFVTLARQGAM